MSTSLQMPSRLPSPDEAKLALETRQILASQPEQPALQLELLDDPDHRAIKLPAAAVRLLMKILDEMSNGNAVTVIPVHAELTTQEAADLLNVSRPYFVQLLEKKEIPFRKVNTHRRVRYEDVMAYKNRIDSERRKALDELAALSQEMGLE